MLAFRRLASAALLALFLALPLTARAATLSVPAQYATIQAGVNAAANGDTVLVADGTYTGTGNQNIDFLGKNITVASVNGAAKTIIDCQGTVDNLHRGFYIHSGETTAILSGFTIMHGTTAGISSPDSGDGGGICIDGASATVQNMVLTGNTAVGSGGGIYDVCSHGETIHLENCTVSGNTSLIQDGSGVYNFITGTGVITMSHCLVSRNGASDVGGGIYNGIGTGNGSIALASCMVSGNTAIDGGGIYNYNNSANGTISFTNCVVRDNTATGNGNGDDGYGGGLYNLIGSTGFINMTSCTISGNVAYSQDSGIYNNTVSPVSLTDTIVYDNTSDGFHQNPGITANFGAVDATVTYSDIQGGYAGTGNIDADPVFAHIADPTGLTSPESDLHLQSGSPCLGRGVAVVGVDTDFDGAARHNPPSMGAYELAVAAPTHQWVATAIAGGVSGKTSILWTRADGAAAIWTLDRTGNALYYTSVFGPYAGWRAIALSVGTDDSAHILWTNTNGAMTLWTLTYVSSTPSYGPIYGPYSRWKATNIATDTNNATHLLWNNANGSMTLWTLPVTGSPTYSPVFGPISGWTAKTISTDQNNAAHVLWANTNGAMTLWTVGASGAASYGPVYGPFAGWTAAGLTMDSVGASHVLWNNTNGSMTLWTLPVTGSPLYSPVFGPYAGWTAVSLNIAIGGANTHVLWDNTSGAMTPWTLDASNQFLGAFPTYGPY